jgi:patatin-like phospholipase/acyl hydrolase
MSKKVFILSIDGGGLKGLIAIKVMQVIEKITGVQLAERADLLAGTSTGGLIACALAVKDKHGKANYDLQHIENIYIEVGKSVFQQNSLTLTGKETQEFSKILLEIFGTLKLADTRKPVFVPTYDVTDNRVLIFKSRSALNEPAKNIALVDVCRATSAITPVFPKYTLKYNGRKIDCIDGGHYLRNPSISAIAEIWKHKKYYHSEHLKEKDISVLSISTGRFTAGKKDWTTNISDILHEQYSDRQYIKQQKLDIALDKINFLRVDLHLGTSGFTFMKLFEWMNRISALGENEGFKKDLKQLMQY